MCRPREGVILLYRKRQKIENKEQDQYKEPVRTLNEELTSVTKKLKKESYLREEAKKAKASLVTELSTLREEMEKAKAMVEFKAS